jgi:hypothetical protein
MLAGLAAIPLAAMPTAPLSRNTRRARRPRRAPNYDRKLARRITLEDGTKLATLRDSANLFAERFATVKSWRLLELAIERLIAAAESAERDKVKAATDSIARVLGTRR